jgi:hypothetical protein
MLWEMCPEFVALLDRPADPKATVTTCFHPVTALWWSDEPRRCPHGDDQCRDALMHLLYVRDRLQRGRSLKRWARNFWKDARAKAPNGAFFTRTELTPELTEILRDGRRATVETCRNWRKLVAEGKAKAEAEAEAQATDAVRG